MDPKTSADDLRQQLFNKWHEEHHQLEEFISQLRQWAYEIGQMGIPHFGEAAGKLAKLRERLVTHFEQEDEIGNQLSDHQAAPSAEVQATCRAAAHDHANLLRRLDELIARLCQTEPPFDSWEQAIGEVDLFLDAMEEHEEQETANLTWLSPQSDDEPT